MAQGANGAGLALAPFLTGAVDDTAGSVVGCAEVGGCEHEDLCGTSRFRIGGKPCN